MSYKDIGQPAVWRSFFADASGSEFSIVLHRVDGIASSSIGPEVTIIPTMKTGWGEFNLVEVQHRLFETAFADPDSAMERIQ